METLWLILTLLIFLAGLLGTVVPGMPGLPLIFAGQLLYAWATGFRVLGTDFLIMMLLLTAFGVLVDYASGPVVARRAGASPLGVAGALVGGIAGALLLGPLGLLVGPLAGAVLGELAYGQTLRRAAEIGWRAFLGVWVGMILQILVALAMITLFLLRVF